MAKLSRMFPVICLIIITGISIQRMYLKYTTRADNHFIVAMFSMTLLFACLGKYDSNIFRRWEKIYKITGVSFALLITFMVLISNLLHQDITKRLIDNWFVVYISMFVAYLVKNNQERSSNHEKRRTVHSKPGKRNESQSRRKN